MEIYDPKTIESKWSKFWLEKKVYQPDLTTAKKPYYNLMMFPYPSAEGLHVGNMYAFTGADVHGRFKRMQGFDVFEPIGLDGFGIHSENYAIKIGRHPKEHAKISEKHFYEQLHMIGNGFAWDQKLETYDPDYYRWTQWLFVQMYKHGLAYRKKAMVNWCPSCKTVLSDEQVEGGVCERCKTPTTRKETEQWFFKITAYADRLLNNLDKIDWPEKIKIAQRNWIGRSEGVEIEWKINEFNQSIWTFTTRPDTIYGATFLVLAPDHPLTKNPEFPKSPIIAEYINRSLKRTEQQRKAQEKTKTGVDSGLKAVHPLTGEKISVWIADFVLMGYGTGAVMGVPAHDERDRAFADEFKLPVVDILKNTDRIFGELRQKNAVKVKVNYHLRDWLISRQRYWGPPIPMIFCQSCADKKSLGNSEFRIQNSELSKPMAGWYSVAEDQLPVLLPDIKDFKPTGDGLSPLQKAPKSWLETACPKCGGIAKRETDVFDTFLDSAWYFLRYPSVKTQNSKLKTQNHSSKFKAEEALPWDLEITKKWLPVNAYIGGAEHAVLHLLYSRFVWMCLKDWGYLPFKGRSAVGRDWDEPFPFLFSHGLIIKDGAKMSKSRGNVVNPDEYIGRYGADALRMYLMFLGSYDQGGDFRDTGMAGMYRFLERVWKAFQNKIKDQKSKIKDRVNTDLKLQIILQRTIKKVTEDIAKFKYNTAIAALMEFMNAYEEKNPDGSEKMLSVDDGGKVIKLLAPFTPYLSEEIWHNLYPDSSESIHLSLWPEYDPKMLEGEQIEIPVQINGKTRTVIAVNPSVAQSQPEVVKVVMENQRVLKYLEGKKIVKIIFVANKIINLIIN